MAYVAYVVLSADGSTEEVAATVAAALGTTRTGDGYAGHAALLQADGWRLDVERADAARLAGDHAGAGWTLVVHGPTAADADARALSAVDLLAAATVWCPVPAGREDPYPSPLRIIADEAKRISGLPFEEHDAEMRASAARTGLGLGSLQRGGAHVLPPGPRGQGGRGPHRPRPLTGVPGRSQAGRGSGPADGRDRRARDPTAGRTLPPAPAHRRTRFT